MTSAKAPPFTRTSTAFLQAIIVLFALGTFALMLWEPHLEGRNKHATAFEVYFKDPFLAYAYIASIPFFVALYQAFRLLGYAGRNRIFSPQAVRALRTIKFCAIAVVIFVIGAEIFILLSEEEDKAGGIVMGIVIAFGSTVVATVAAMFERLLQNAVDIKSENDLTV
jgi:hypothetical protein